jgi:hypothetical protein
MLFPFDLIETKKIAVLSSLNRFLQVILTLRLKAILNEIGIDSISFDVAKYTYLLQLCES